LLFIYLFDKISGHVWAVSEDVKKPGVVTTLGTKLTTLLMLKLKLEH
jgi:hypothetical protein